MVSDVSFPTFWGMFRIKVFSVFVSVIGSAVPEKLRLVRFYVKVKADALRFMGVERF